MRFLSASVRSGALVCLAWAVMAGSAWAEKPDSGGKPGKVVKAQKYQNDVERAPSHEPAGVSVDVQIGAYFGAPQREAVRGYYQPRASVGKCPPGLAKKRNGCQPPGQARKWLVGQRLPADVVTYPVPNEVSVRIGLPPAGHKYVRVAADILLIAIGTNMVVDAIEDLGRL